MFNNMMKTVNDLQEKMKEVEEKMGQVIVTGESGGGLVIAKVSCNKEVIGLEIDESLYQDKNIDMLKDLIIAAINLGIKNADERKSKEMKEHTAGMLPNIPGFDLGKMFNG